MSSTQHGLGPTRAKVLALLQSAPVPLQVTEVADELGLHKNSARFHLDALVDSSYARRQTVAAGQPGRPPLACSATSEAPTMTNLHLLEVTQVLLAQFVAPAENALTRAEQAGRTWGAGIATQDASPADAFGDLVDHLAERGFGTSHDVTTSTLTFARCPFRASIDPEQLPFICAMHQGFLDGYLEASRSGLTAGRIDIGPRTCRAEVTMSA